MATVSKVRVYGKAQNRTSLGIMHAYMAMYPQATLADLKKAFPDSLNPDMGMPTIFAYQKDVNVYAKFNGYFSKPEEMLKTGDGKKVAVVTMWTKPSFERLVDWAKQYGIEVAKFEAATKGIGKKGGFKLEYLNGYVPPVAGKKGMPWWAWLIIALVILIPLLFFLLKPAPAPQVQVVEKVVEKVVVDTVYVQQIEQIEKDFNAVKFEQGKSELSDEAKFVLYDLVKLLQKHPELKVSIVGHTSAEGDFDFNQKLSEARAKAAVDFIISRGIDPARMTFAGKGSTQLKNTADPMASENRRTEFLVIE